MGYLSSMENFTCVWCEEEFEYEIDNDGIWDIDCPKCGNSNQYEVR